MSLISEEDERRFRRQIEEKELRRREEERARSSSFLPSRYESPLFEYLPLDPYLGAPTPRQRSSSRPDMTPITAVPTVKPKVSLESVVLSQEKKDEIQAALAQIANADLIFKHWGFGDIFEKGTAITLLFYGIPGTGKTLMAQAIADELKAELKIYGTAEIQSSEPGGAERAIKKVFETARKFFTANKKQQVILFDECDSLLYDRNKVGVIMAAQINAMLTEIERHDGIVIFTTNRMGKLDPALERRIAAKIEFPFPDAKQREAIWKRMIPSKAPLAADVNFKKLASYPIAGGSIKNAVLNAARMAAYQKSPQITFKHFKTAIEKESIAAQAFSAESEGGHTGELGDIHMEDSNKVVIGDKNMKGDLYANKYKRK